MIEAAETGEEVDSNGEVTEGTAKKKTPATAKELMGNVSCIT